MNINLKEAIKPISYVKSHIAEILEYINEHKSPIVITQKGVARGILIDVESYQEMIDTIALSKLAQTAEAEIANGEVVDNKEVFDDLAKQIREKRRNAKQIGAKFKSKK